MGVLNVVVPPQALQLLLVHFLFLCERLGDSLLLEELLGELGQLSLGGDQVLVGLFDEEVVAVDSFAGLFGEQLVHHLGCDTSANPLRLNVNVL